MTLDGGEGHDIMFGWDGDDLLKGGDGDDAMDGEAGTDTLDGGEGDDILFGGAGDDSLSGGAGNDAIFGWGGHNILDGGAGDDTIVVESQDIATGGSGDDTFVVIADESSDTAQILDFNENEDSIEIYYIASELSYPSSEPLLELEEIPPAEGSAVGTEAEFAIIFDGSQVAVVTATQNGIEAGNIKLVAL